jgi:hypothetical protein
LQAPDDAKAEISNQQLRRRAIQPGLVELADRRAECAVQPVNTKIADMQHRGEMRDLNRAFGPVGSTHAPVRENSDCAAAIVFAAARYFSIVGAFRACVSAAISRFPTLRRCPHFLTVALRALCHKNALMRGQQMRRIAPASHFKDRSNRYAAEPP